jgi:GNAT superfamily N-acetyltransferase
MESETLISEKEEKEFIGFLHEKIKDFNNQTSSYFLEARKPGAKRPLNIILQDRAGNYLGGLSASTYWGWLVIDDFFVPEELRGQGIGAGMLETAEKIALERGCIICHLSTYEFQARTFYEKQGYYVTGKLDGYPPGSAFYWMCKDLQQD